MSDIFQNIINKLKGQKNEEINESSQDPRETVILYTLYRYLGGVLNQPIAISKDFADSCIKELKQISRDGDFMLVAKSSADNEVHYLFSDNMSAAKYWLADESCKAKNPIISESKKV